MKLKEEIYINGPENVMTLYIVKDDEPDYFYGVVYALKKFVGMRLNINLQKVGYKTTQARPQYCIYARGIPAEGAIIDEEPVLYISTCEKDILDAVSRTAKELKMKPKNIKEIPKEVKMPGRAKNFLNNLKESESEIQSRKFGDWAVCFWKKGSQNIHIAKKCDNGRWMFGGGKRKLDYESDWLPGDFEWCAKGYFSKERAVEEAKKGAEKEMTKLSNLKENKRMRVLKENKKRKFLKESEEDFIAIKRFDQIEKLGRAGYLDSIRLLAYGPFGEDIRNGRKCFVSSLDPADASDDGDEENRDYLDSLDVGDLVVFNQDIGQSGLNWIDADGVYREIQEKNLVIEAGSVPEDVLKEVGLLNSSRVRSFSFDFIADEYWENHLDELKDNILSALQNGVNPGFTIVGNPDFGDTSWTKAEYGIKENKKVARRSRIKESNRIGNGPYISDTLDMFLHDVAQELGGIDYSDIIAFEKTVVTPDDPRIKELKKIYRKYRRVAEYGDEEELAEIAARVQELLEGDVANLDEAIDNDGSCFDAAIEHFRYLDLQYLCKHFGSDVTTKEIMEDGQTFIYIVDAETGEHVATYDVTNRKLMYLSSWWGGDEIASMKESDRSAVGVCDCGNRTNKTFRQRAELDGYDPEDIESLADFADLDLDNDLCQGCYATIRDEWLAWNNRTGESIHEDVMSKGEDFVVEVNDNGKWKAVGFSKNDSFQGVAEVSTKARAKIFGSEEEAKKSGLYKRLKNADIEVRVVSRDEAI